MIFLRILVVLAALAISQDAARSQDTVATKKKELKAVEKALFETDAARAAIENVIAVLAEDRASFNSQLVGTASQIQAFEASISGLENRLEDLGIEEIDMRGALRDRREVLVKIIAALQRMGHNPPPALLVHPSDALASIRSAIALGAIVPQMRGEAEALIADLQALGEIRSTIRRERDTLQAESAALRRQQARLSLLMEIKRRKIVEERSELAAVREKAEKLAVEVNSFEELIAGLQKEIDVFRKTEAVAASERAALAEDDGVTLSAEQYRSYFAGLPKDRSINENPLVTKSDPSRTEPAIPFSDAVGMLPLPARGTVIGRVGEDDGFGDVSRGLSIATRQGAQIVAPNDGWVVYAGPFRSYQQLLIIDAGEGYHMVMAGMDRISVSPGQFVLMGEPVGTMSEEPVRVAATVLTGGKSQPVLYVELRQGGKAIDPAPWWAERTATDQQN